MGGFGSAIGDLARAGVDAATEALEHTKVHLAQADAAFNSQEHVFKSTPEGTWINEQIKNYGLHARAQVTSAGLKQALEERTPHPTATDPITNTPLNIRGTKLETGPVDIGKHINNGNKAMRHVSLGLNDGYGVTAATSIHQKYGRPAAEAFSNAVALVMKDYVNPLASREGEVASTEEIQQAAKKGQKVEAPFSTFKKRVYNAGVPLSDVKPAYTPPQDWERSILKTAYATFSPLIVLSHLSSVFNGALGSDPLAFMRGIAAPIGKSLAESQDHLETLSDTSVYLDKYMRGAREWNLSKATGHPEFSGSTAAGYVMRLFHQPLFSRFRDLQLLQSATMGQVLAEKLGRNVIKYGETPRLKAEASYYGLDTAKLKANGGNLDQKDLSRAIYNFTNEHYFTDNSLNRSRVLQGTPFGRILGMYHGYVTRQSQLMRRALFRAYRVSGPIGVARNLAVLGVLMPMAAEGSKILRETLFGQNAGGDLKQDIGDMEGKHGAKGFIETYLGAHAQLATMGVYAHWLRGALVHNLVGVAAGPVISSAAELGEDVISGVHKTYTKEKIRGKDWKPVERDLEYDTPGISLLAHFLSHRLTPSAKDKPYNDPARQLLYKAEGKDKFGHTQDELKDKSDSHQNMFTN